MLKRISMLAVIPFVSLIADGKGAPEAFTGKINGNAVRMRASADVESPIIRELNKDELVVVVGEKNDFYAVMPQEDVKAYVFRSFVIENVVEGDRVNVRLAPDKDAPVIAHLSTGDHVNGKVSPEHNKWLEITPPNNTRFFIAKEFVDFAGSPEMKAVHDKRKVTVQQLTDSAHLLVQAEMRKPFNEIDMEHVSRHFETIIEDYADFPAQVEVAKKALAELQETYLQRKIAYLESKASQLNKNMAMREEKSTPQNKEPSILSPTDRMQIWEPIEEALYLSWSSMHHAKTMKDFYEDQKLKATTITGIVESYKDPVKNKPGDFILKDKDMTTAFIYSTSVNLQDYVGKQLTLIVSERNNNHFAFPAFYVLDTE
ncbi:MAG: hypothetical protein KBC64_01695 [Simkaniaceae bacterium]|nr:hypothetical protein [Simkaniaceae bacterium]